MLEQLKELLQDYWKGDLPTVTLDSVLTSDLGMDSMQLFDLVCAIEEHFKIEIPDRELPKFVSVRDVVEYLETVTE